MLTSNFQSSVVKSARYLEKDQTLWLTLTRSSYRYEGVPPDVYLGLLLAPSAGVFYNENIKHQYTAQKQQ